MQDICKNPKPTYNDMALIPAQGRDPAAVAKDVDAARATEHARRMAVPSQTPQWVLDSDPDCSQQE